MRLETSFELVGDLIGVDAVVVGPTGRAHVQLIVDTGAVADLGYGIDGVLGMDFLRLFNIEIRPGERRILVERIAS